MALHTEIVSLVGLVFLLGLKHGLDPDHLVAIDGLTRSGRSRWTGLFFSLGHGVAVTLAGVGLAIAAAQWQPPSWLEYSGALLSIGALLVLGVANLAASLRALPGAPVPLVGLRGRWMAARLAAASHPVVIAAIGAAFALSFDTLSHALLFSATGATAAGWLFAAVLGLVFTLGMVFTDALNGWWVARMICSADRRAAGRSRLMSIAIATLCFVIAAIGLAKLAHAAVGELAAALAPFVGLATLGAVAAAWLVGRRGTIAFRI